MMPHSSSYYTRRPPSQSSRPDDERGAHQLRLTEYVHGKMMNITAKEIPPYSSFNPHPRGAPGFHHPYGYYHPEEGRDACEQYYDDSSFRLQDKSHAAPRQDRPASLPKHSMVEVTPLSMASGHQVPTVSQQRHHNVTTLQRRQVQKSKNKKALFWIVGFVSAATVINIAFSGGLISRSRHGVISSVKTEIGFSSNNDISNQALIEEASLFSADTLLSLYDTLPERRESPSFREVSYAFARRDAVAFSGDITLVTQMSMDKFPRLTKLLQRWNGPISCAVYLTSRDSIQKLCSLISQQSEAFHRLVTLHVMLERPPSLTSILPGYPFNRLRNLALDNIETEYFFYDDVDFMPSQDAYDYLREFISTNNDPNRFSTLYVIPAFEEVMSEEISATNIAAIPSNKEELQMMIELNQAQGFHMDYFKAGHGSTQYNRWYNCTEEGKYQVDYKRGFEPYVLGTRHAIHRFEDRFRGHGHDKQSWISEAHFRGYNFEVLCGAFIFHLYHPEGRARATSAGNVKLNRWYEDIYWKSRYSGK